MYVPVLVAVVDTIPRYGTQRLAIAVQNLRVECVLQRKREGRREGGREGGRERGRERGREEGRESSWLRTTAKPMPLKLVTSGDKEHDLPFVRSSSPALPWLH